MANVHVLDHPLIQHKLAILRNKKTSVKEFRELVGEIAGLMCYEATRDLPTEEVEIETPICKMKSKVLAGKKLGIVPILRAGLGMVDGVTTLVPAARIGHIIGQGAALDQAGDFQVFIQSHFQSPVLLAHYAIPGLFHPVKSKRSAISCQGSRQREALTERFYKKTAGTTAAPAAKIKLTGYPSEPCPA